MNYLKIKNNIKNRNAGFTLVEMIVSVGLFSIAMMIMLGAVLTIVDVNRKSQSLTTAMNNLNFALESMTRTIKTGLIADTQSLDGKSIIIMDQDGEQVTYEFKEVADLGAIYKNNVPITSSQMDIESATFEVIRGSDARQSRVLINIEGKVSIGTKISSDFSLQTTVSQRDLDIKRYVGS